jgi:hypothetical protein
MKKLIGVFILIALFAMPIFSQGIVGVKSYDLGTIANSVDESYRYENFSGLLKQFDCAVIDSMIISMTVVGEADVDSLDWYPVNWTTTGTVVKGTVKTFTVTLNVAAAGTGTEVLLVTNAGVASTLFRGYEGFGFMTRGATSGNDATDPNNGKVTITFYGQ